jgi:putative transcriptional regulator
LGYSGWGPGQLEKELKQGDWLLLPANQKLIFNTPDEIMWKTAYKNLGIELKELGGTAGIS